MATSRKRTTKKTNTDEPVLIRRFESNSPTLSMPPIKTTKMISQAYGRAVAGFTLIAIVVAGLILLITGSRATITLTPTGLEQQVGFDVLIQPNNTTTTTDKLSLPGRLLEMATSTSITINVATSTEPDPNAKATGMVIIRNRSASPQALVATTRLLSPDNILFRLDKGITVPANGEISAAVTADQGGSQGAIEPTTFTIPGLNATRQKDIDAVSTQKFIQVATVAQNLTDEMIAAAKIKALQQLTTDLTKTLTPYLFDNEKLDNRAVTTTDLSLTTTIKKGDEVGAITFTGQVRISALLFNQQELQNKVVERALQNKDLNNTKIKPDSLTFEVIRQANNSLALGIVKGQLTLLTSQINVSPDMLTGRSLDDAKVYLQLLPGVEQIDIKLTPGLLQRLPHDPNRITIKILPLP